MQVKFWNIFICIICNAVKIFVIKDLYRIEIRKDETLYML